MEVKDQLKVEVIQAIAALTSTGLTFEEAKKKLLEDLNNGLSSAAIQNPPK